MAQWSQSLRKASCSIFKGSTTNRCQPRSAALARRSVRAGIAWPSCHRCYLMQKSWHLCWAQGDGESAFFCPCEASCALVTWDQRHVINDGISPAGCRSTFASCQPTPCFDPRTLGRGKAEELFRLEGWEPWCRAMQTQGTFRTRFQLFCQPSSTLHTNHFCVPLFGADLPFGLLQLIPEWKHTAIAGALPIQEKCWQGKREGSVNQ